MEISSIESFLDYYEKIWARTIRVFDEVPDDKINWKPNNHSFSFMEILIHIGNLERYMFAETIINNLNLYPGHENLQIKDKPGLMDYIVNLHQQTVNLLTSLTTQELENKCQTPDNISIRVWKWLRAMIEHHIHHRGQIYTYLNLLDLPSPPLYGLTSEEVKERGKKH